MRPVCVRPEGPSRSMTQSAFSKLRGMTSTRASKIIALIIALNVLLGILAAGVILSPEYYALDQAIRKGMSLPRPPEKVMNATAAGRLWFVNGTMADALREMSPRVESAWLMRTDCGRLCRVRRVIVIAARSRFESRDAMLRAYIATRAHSALPEPGS